MNTSIVSFSVGPWTLDPGPWTMDPGPWTLDPGPWTLDPGPSTLDPGPSTLDPGPSTLDPGPWTLDPGPWTLDPGPWTLALSPPVQAYRKYGYRVVITQARGTHEVYWRSDMIFERCIYLLPDCNNEINGSDGVTE